MIRSSFVYPDVRIPAAKSPHSSSDWVTLLLSQDKVHDVRDRITLGENRHHIDHKVARC